MVGRLPMAYVEFRVGTGIPTGELVLGYNFVVTKKVIYDYDSKAIIAIPLKNWQAGSILMAYKVGHAQHCAAGLQPKLQCLDNEASHALQEYLHHKGGDFQLVPPHLH